MGFLSHGGEKEQAVPEDSCNGSTYSHEYINTRIHILKKKNRTLNLFFPGALPLSSVLGAES